MNDLDASRGIALGLLLCTGLWLLIILFVMEAIEILKCG